MPGIIGRLERRYLIGLGIFIVRYFSITQAKRFQPDLILLYQGHYHGKSSILKLKRVAWVTGYHNDNVFSALEDGRHRTRYKHLIKAIPHYSSFHVYRHSNVEQILNLGVKNVGLLKSYFIPWLDLFKNEISEKFKCNIIFVGHPEPDGRELYLTRLLELNLDLKIFGDPKGWYALIPKIYHTKLNQIEILSPDDYRRALSSSKICLAFFSKWNRDDYTRRVFEIPALGKFLLSERTDMMRSLYAEDEEAVFFSDKDEFVNKIVYYLKNEEERQKVEKNGHQRCIQSGYDIYCVMNQFLKDIERWKK